MRLLLLSASLSALAAANPALAEDPAGAPSIAPATQLPPVSVLTTRTRTPVDEVPATVTVFTDEQIEELLVTDIKDLIRFEPGVSVVSQPARFGAALGTAGRAGNEGFTIRGLGGDRVLMVIDGTRIPDGFVFGAQSVGRGGYADLDLMKSVEILRGPSSALYGSDGVAGAVSFTTKDPAELIGAGETFGARARVGYNSADDGLTKSAVIAGRTRDISAMLAWTARDASETETQGDVSGLEVRPVAIGGVTAPGYNYALRTEANPQEISSDAWLAKLMWDFAPGQSLRLSYDLYEMDMQANVISGRASHFVGSPPPSATSVLNLVATDSTERERIGLDWRLGDALGLDSAQVSVFRQDATTRQHTFEDRVGTDRIRDNQFNNEVFGVAAFAVKTLGDHRLTFGGDWSETTQEGIRDGTAPPFGETFPTSPFPRTDYTLAGAFIQDEISLLDGALKIVPAARWDAYELSTANDPLYVGARADQKDDRFSPKVGVVWWGSEQVGVFANWAEGFKAPTPSQVNNGFSNIASGYLSIPNPDLRPETSESFELGLRVREVPLLGGRLAGQLVGFQSDYSDFISQQQVAGDFTPTDPAVFQFVNFTDVEIEGLEAKADIWWANGFSARFAAAYAEGTSTEAGVTTALETIDPIKVVAAVGYDDPAGRFGGQAIVTWSQAKDPADTDGLSCFNANPALGCAVGDDFVLLDLTAYWIVNDQVTARVGVFNVFDETYSWWSDIRGVSNSSAVKDAYTQPGRNIGLSLALRY
ncbi:TonB-dependent hemoglobin/transferrin/lactoferrin family receptor [Brevundimonas sp. Root1279]|uniref:TonB-dependent hemoglobin/transferrin/lactoferrin family receptor n=1 Tax=Brevundimonas sp. Root1279 TaxID=1736443 RepID=UPI0006F3FDE6|nr:TonB-dependent hemoglobin/transferrin/lactoferrin family receptor [Brevundimonas sp. Root1279]KQW83147.1 TonB-dependent receptor [Brevundimonas sp. Root1279]